MSTFDFSAPIANQITGKLMQTRGDLIAKGDTMAQLQMAVLVSAEELAAMAGVVPWGRLPSGEKAITQVGAARARIKDAPLPVQVAYLGAHHAVRRTLPQVERLTLPEIGVLPIAVVVALSVTGVAALVAGAWYARESKDADVRLGEKWSRDLFVANNILDGMKAEIAKTGHISSDAWKALERFAQSEKNVGDGGVPIWGYVGAIAFGVGLWYVTRKGRAS